MRETTHDVERDTFEDMGPDAVFCPQCGTKNPGFARFCNQCGERLPDAQEISAWRKDLPADSPDIADSDSGAMADSAPDRIDAPEPEVIEATDVFGNAEGDAEERAESSPVDEAEVGELESAEPENDECKGIEPEGTESESVESQVTEPVTFASDDVQSANVQPTSGQPERAPLESMESSTDVDFSAEAIGVESTGPSDEASMTPEVSPKPSKKMLRWLIPALVAAAVVIGGVLIWNGSAVAVPSGAADYVGQSGEAVLAEFTDLGFEDIHVVEMANTPDSAAGSVTRISIKGDAEFLAGERFPLDDRVVITQYEGTYSGSPIPSSDGDGDATEATGDERTGTEAFATYPNADTQG